MLPAAGVLVVAWMTADTMGELGVGEYLGALSRAPSCWPSSPPSSLFSPRLFSFSIGSTFGTFGVMLPIGGARIAASGDLRLLIPVFGAVLAGSIFGDHTSPLSDTTIDPVGYRVGDQPHRSRHHSIALRPGVCLLLDARVSRLELYREHGRGPDHGAGRARRVLLLSERKVRRERRTRGASRGKGGGAVRQESCAPVTGVRAMRLVLEAEPDLHADLDVGDLAILDVAAHL